MSDDSSISQGVIDEAKNFGTEAVKSTLDTVSPKNVVKSIVGQIIGKEGSSEDEAKKHADEAEGQRRVREIEAEMQRIASQREQLTGPEIPIDSNNTNEDLQQNAQQVQDIALKRAQTRTESDKANKG